MSLTEADIDAIVDGIIDDLQGRSGLGDMFDECDLKTQTEIRETWMGIVREIASVAS